MCEQRIEKAAGSVAGVESADWDQETTKITVALDTTKTDLLQVHKTIADVGHDTELLRADDETYAKLPACCKYERKEGESAKKE